jgi:hypothetical protein
MCVQLHVQYMQILNTRKGENIPCFVYEGNFPVDWRSIHQRYASHFRPHLPSIGAPKNRHLSPVAGLAERLSWAQNQQILSLDTCV